MNQVTKAPMEILADIRAAQRPTVSVEVAAKEVEVIDLHAQANDMLIAALTPSNYTPEQVAMRLGVAIDPFWTPKTMDRLMGVADITQPLLSIRAVATSHHAQYELKGRDEMRKIMQDVYATYCVARQSIYGVEIREALKLQVIEKYRKNSTDTSLFIRTVFLNAKHKQVHSYGKALEYAFFKKWPVADFASQVYVKGGFEGVRQLAFKELPKTAEQRAAAGKRIDVKETKDIAIKALLDHRRSKAAQDMSKFEGQDVVVRAYVKGGVLQVYWVGVAAEQKPVTAAIDEVLWAQATNEAERVGMKDVACYIHTGIRKETEED